MKSSSPHTGTTYEVEHEKITIQDRQKSGQKEEKENGKKLVSIIGAGSRGDIQPLIGLALELSKTCRVRILANAGSSQMFIESFPGLEYAEIWPGDPQEILSTDQGLRNALAHADTFKFFKMLDEQQRKNTPMIMKNFINEMKQNTPDLLIAGGPASEYMQYYARRVLKLHVLCLRLQTLGYNPNHAPLGLPKLPFGMHYYLLLMAKKCLFKNFERFDEIAVQMGERPLSLTQNEFMQDASNFIKGFASHKTLICQSPLFRHVLSPGVDPERYIYTGACIIDAEHQRKYNDNFGGDDGQKQIELFLDQDKNMKPVYIGFGSMLGNTPECMVVMAVKALMHANERGIILGGYAGLSLELLCKATDDEDVIVYAKKNILFVKAASHEWLFPLVKCIVHHGGAGTTQAALRSGVPTIITPVFLDQFCHSHVVNELGVGKGFKYGMKRLTYNELGSAIKAVQNEETCRRCKEVSMTIRQENGNESAAKAIQKILDESPQSSSSRPSLLESQRNQPYIAPELFVAALKAITVACVIKALVHQ